MVEIQNFTKSYKKFDAVKDISISIAGGEVYGLLGPNGAGKTTTLRAIATLLKPTSGSISVAGFDTVKHPLEVRKNIGIVNGGMKVSDKHTGLEIMKFFGGFYDLSESELKSRIEWASDLLKIDSGILGKQIKDMSTGMQQKIVIARAILHQPKVLMLDEATAGLDVFARRALLDFVIQYRQMEKTVIYSTHVMAEADEVCSRVGFIYKGSMIFQGTREEAESHGNGNLERGFINVIEGIGEVAA